MDSTHPNSFANFLRLSLPSDGLAQSWQGPYGLESLNNVLSGSSQKNTGQALCWRIITFAAGRLFKQVDVGNLKAECLVFIKLQEEIIPVLCLFLINISLSFVFTGVCLWIGRADFRADTLLWPWGICDTDLEKSKHKSPKGSAYLAAGAWREKKQRLEQRAHKQVSTCFHTCPEIQLLYCLCTPRNMECL